MIRTVKIGILALMLTLGVICTSAPAADDLAAGFQNPPDSAKPHTWWHWMNGNVTKAGITADLEAMKKSRGRRRADLQRRLRHPGRTGQVHVAAMG